MASASLIGIQSPSTSWQTAMDLYYADKVIAALEVVQPNAAAYGGSALRQYRLIEGEAHTRARSEREPLGPKLEIEYVPEEVPHHEAVAGVVNHAVAAVAKRLEWNGAESVLATILVAEADADWHEARYGYCVDKVPYDKICLPQVSTGDPTELWRVAAHEFAHVVTLNVTNATAPHWIDEGVSCVMEGRSPLGAALRLRRAGIWRSPAQMSSAFDVDRRQAAKLGGVGAAYAQATVLVGYLHSLKGDSGLAALLRAFTDHSPWTDFVTLVSSRDPAEAALNQAFGFDRQELFDRTKAWADALPE